MRLLMLITGMKSGGAERVMATLCNELSLKHQVRLCIMKSADSDYTISDRVEVVAGNIKSKSLIKSLLFTKKIAEEWKPDIVLSFMTKTNIIALLAKQIFRFNFPVIIAERANPYNTKGLLKLARNYLYRYADGATFQTQQARDYYNKIINCMSIVVRNPLNSDFNIKPYNGLRKKKIVAVGRLSEEKNQELLIRAFSIIATKYPDFKVEIYGEGPLRKKLSQTIENLSLGGRVFLMGRKNNIENYIQDASIFVLTSNSEGMPNALLEAMALGIPSIATDCPIGGPSAIIQDGKNGILIPTNDERALQTALECLINDEKYADKLSRSAQLVSEIFNTQKVCAIWEKFLLKIVGEKSGHQKNHQ